MYIKILTNVGVNIAKKGQVYEVVRMIKQNDDWTRFLVDEGFLMLDLENDKFEIIEDKET